MNEPDIKALIDRWATTHPTPDEPALITGAGVFTPRQIAEAVQAGAPIGLLFMKMWASSPPQKNSFEKLQITVCKDKQLL